MLTLISNQGRQHIKNRSKRNDRNECLLPFKWCDRTIGAGAGAFTGEENECCDLMTGGGPRFFKRSLQKKCS